MPLNNKQSYNRYMKSLKVRLVAFTETEGYIFFEIRNQGYVIKSDMDELFSFGEDPYIYRCQENIEPPFALATELEEDVFDVIEVIMIKCENPYEQGIYIDDFDFLDEAEIELSAKQQKYFKLFPEIVAFDRKYREENEEILNIMIVDDYCKN